MALRRTLSKRLLPVSTTTALSPPPNPSRTTTNFLHRAINSHSSILSVPVGEILGERLNICSGNRLRLDSLRPPPPRIPEVEGGGGFCVTAEELKRVVSVMQMERVRETLRYSGKCAVSYSEYGKACCDVFGGDREKGSELAKKLDESGNVVVLGGIVFLWPDQVAKSVEKLISQSIEIADDSRKKELKNLENKKTVIDQKARSLVRMELYCGLGFFILQTLGFMRLTFWELSWDVMEPICFFVTSLHFALAYAFFLRTSTEPSFEGYFHRRFKVKQMKLMKIHNFDLEGYNRLREVFYPSFLHEPRCDEGAIKSPAFRYLHS